MYIHVPDAARGFERPSSRPPAPSPPLPRPPLRWPSRRRLPLWSRVSWSPWSRPPRTRRGRRRLPRTSASQLRPRPRPPTPHPTAAPTPPPDTPPPEPKPVHPASTGNATRDAQRALESGDTAKAIELARQATAGDPANTEAWLTLGAAYESSGKPAMARSAYRSCATQGRGDRVAECRALLAQ